MATGDGLLARFRPPSGFLSADAAHALGRAARECGNGVLELTRRGAIQARGLSEQTHETFARAVVAAGLADPDPERERRRVVVETPAADRDVAGTARATEAIFCDDPRLRKLPPKFCVVVEGAIPLGDIGAAIIVRRDGGYCHVRLATGSRAVTCGAAEAPSVAARLAIALIAAGPAAELATVFAAAGLAPNTAFDRGDAPEWIGGRDGVFGVGLPFGVFDADALANLATDFGDGFLYLAPGRAVLLTGIANARVPGLRVKIARLGLIADAADPRRRVVACPGSPACASATVDTRAIAQRLAPLGLAVHVSGCAKGCAHPASAAFTLVGVAGRYDVVRNGRAADAPCATELPTDQALAWMRAAAA